MKQYQGLKSQFLANNGLNMQAVFNLNQLPSHINVGLTLAQNTKYTQLIVLAHGGKNLWRELKQSKFKSANPVDDYSVQLVEDYFKKTLPNQDYKILYPSTEAIGLSALGEYAGWHHDSPFRLGINIHWGSWFAYRVVLLADTDFIPSEKINAGSPCGVCIEKPCINACPPNALEERDLSLNKCLSYRKETSSKCQLTCLSRVSCPIGEAQRYTDEQLNYHYSISLRMIDEFY